MKQNNHEKTLILRVELLKYCFRFPAFSEISIWAFFVGNCLGTRRLIGKRIIEVQMTSSRYRNQHVSLPPASFPSTVHSTQCEWNKNCKTGEHHSECTRSDVLQTRRLKSRGECIDFNEKELVWKRQNYFRLIPNKLFDDLLRKPLPTLLTIASWCNYHTQNFRAPSHALPS